VELINKVTNAMGDDGLLAGHLPGYRMRAQQVQFAREVAKTIEHGGVLIAEVGTGVGKTYGYLVPLLLSGKRVMVSTATKALQEQLFLRDLPQLLAAMGRVVKLAMLKGRASYVCLHRLASARDHHAVQNWEQAHLLASVTKWAVATRTGDLSELPDLDEQSAVIPLVTSTSENCLGQQCPNMPQCHVYRARSAALEAELVVVNHHLVFADWQLREASGAELLPNVHTIVFDEAHQLNDIGVQFLGQQFSIAKLQRWLRDLEPHSAALALGACAWRNDVDQIHRGLLDLSKLQRAASASDASRSRSEDWLRSEEAYGVLSRIHVALASLEALLHHLQSMSPRLGVLCRRAELLKESVAAFVQPADFAEVRWSQGEWPHVQLERAPLGVADVFRKQRLLAPGMQSWVFTSATLGSERELDDFARTCGLENAQLLQLPSPFDYQQQAALYIPTDMPEPSDPNHSACVARLVAESAEMLRGKTLVLTTTLRAMRSIGNALQNYFADSMEVEVRMQGDLPKHALLSRISDSSKLHEKGCVLVASVSFWEGIDIPGDALELVVIDKIPFAPPDDPWVRAQSRQLSEKGINAFKHFHIPRAIASLRQGAGRLIRSATDRGVLVICDARLKKAIYGSRILAALPPMRMLHESDELEQALEALTRTSTKMILDS
jgi:ATP-dependent DNA helicase DinG